MKDADPQNISGFERLQVRPAVPRTLCTDCGVSRMADPALCGQVCQFIKPDYDRLETQVHGRARDPNRPDELHFGPFQALYRAKMLEPAPGAQWTGIATGLAAALLTSGWVEAILTMAPHPGDRWRPDPVLVTDPARLADCRGMRMGYAPLLALLETAAERGYKRLGLIGIPCQVYALRAMEQQLGLDRLYVIGTPCSDNTTTERFHQFLALLDEDPDSIIYLEFRADYHVEVRYEDGRVRTIPFLKLPISQLPDDFFPLTCRTCVDYTNVLADITVGYMGGEGQQWLLVRNQRGRDLLDLLGDHIKLNRPGSKGKRKASVTGFMKNTERAAGGLPLRAMPDWVRPIVAWLMPKIGPRGLEFARARVEMKAMETIFHLRRHMRPKMKNMVPDHVWRLVQSYGVERQEEEQVDRTG